MVVAQAFDERVSLDQSSLVSCSNSILANSHQNCWASLIEPTLPLKASKLSPASSFYSNPQRRENTLGRSDPRRSGLQQSVELRSLEIANRVFLVNLIALIVNLVLAMLAFYLSYTNNSPSTTAFAADCILDVMSCAIVLWRYYGDLSGVYMHAREQIACIYLGALFEMSALAIVIKALDDIASGADLILETDVVSRSPKAINGAANLLQLFPIQSNCFNPFPAIMRASLPGSCGNSCLCHHNQL